MIDGMPGEQPVDATEFATRHPLLVVAGCYLADERLLGWLAAYAYAGGHLILGPRTGYSDAEGRARAEVAPATLSECAGVSYGEYSNLTTNVPLVSTPERWQLIRSTNKSMPADT